MRRFELPTPWSVAKCSIQLSYTHIMGRGGFEPPKQIAADLQSVPFGHSGICPLLQYKIVEADDRTRTDNLLITNQLLCQLSHIGKKVGPTGLEPVTLCL